MGGHNGLEWESEAAFLQHLDAVEHQAQADGSHDEYGVVLVNVVGLRHLNRDFGRASGDAVLSELALRLSARVPNAVSLGRVGPSEIAVLVARLPHEEVTQLARLIRLDCKEDVAFEGRRVPIELQVTPRGGPDLVMGNVLWAARNDARWDRLRPLLHRVEHLETLTSSSVEDAHAEIVDLTRRLSDAEDEARRDGLTGTLNRVGAERMLASLPTPFALAFVDLDDLRAFNALPDNYDAGDEALRTVARLLRGVDPGDRVGRWGGDEFLIAVPGITRQQLCDRLEFVLHDEQQHRHVSGRRVTFSAGVADVDNAGAGVAARQQAQALLRHIKDNNLKPAVLHTLPRGGS